MTHLSHAQESTVCISQSQQILQLDLKAIDPVLNVLIDQNCQDLADPTLKLRENYIDYYRSPLNIKRSIGPIELTDSRQAINALTSILGSNPPNLSAAKDCKRALCVLEKIVGSEKAALQMMNIYHETGYALSLNQMHPDKEIIWNEKQVDMSYKSLKKLPKEMLFLPTLKEIQVMGQDYSIHQHYQRIESNLAPRFSNSIGLARMTSKSSGDVLLNHSIFEKGQHHCEHTIIHEIAHHWDYKGLSTSNLHQGILSGFWELADWKEVGPNSYHFDPEKACFITDYAEENPSEHLAETISKFFISPLKLKRSCPEYYEFVKVNVNGGIDPLINNTDQYLEDLLAQNFIDLSDCLKPKFLEYIILENDIFYKHSDTISGYQTIYAPSPDGQCIMAKATPIIEAMQASDPLYCEKGGIKYVTNALEKKLLGLFQSMQQFLKESKSKLTLNQLLGQCFDRLELTEACFKQVVTETINEKLQADQDIANWLNSDWALKQLPKLTNKYSAYWSSDEFNQFASKNKNAFILGCLSGIDKITHQNATTYQAGMFTSSSPAAFEECKKAQKLNQIDDPIFRRVMLTGPVANEINRISSIIIPDLKRFKQQCLTNAECLRTKLEASIEKNLSEFENEKSQLAQLLISKYN
jgi:Mlc titration factor MtfA (ptsG expression regulator)